MPTSRRPWPNISRRRDAACSATTRPSPTPCSGAFSTPRHHREPPRTLHPDHPAHLSTDHVPGSLPDTIIVPWRGGPNLDHPDSHKTLRAALPFACHTASQRTSDGRLARSVRGMRVRPRSIQSDRRRRADRLITVPRTGNSLPLFSDSTSARRPPALPFRLN